MGNISLGLALVAGKNRVPRPATGNTALRTCRFTEFTSLMMSTLFLNSTSSALSNNGINWTRTNLALLLQSVQCDNEVRIGPKLFHSQRKPSQPSSMLSSVHYLNNWIVHLWQLARFLPRVTPQLVISSVGSVIAQGDGDIAQPLIQRDAGLRRFGNASCGRTKSHATCFTRAWVVAD